MAIFKAGVHLFQTIIWSIHVSECTLWSTSIARNGKYPLFQMCHGQKSRFIGDGRPPTFNRNPYNGYINPDYWVDDHPPLYGNNGSLDPGTNRK